MSDKVSALTDDAIVDAVASFGHLGVFVEDIFDGCPTEALLEHLCLDVGDEEIEEALFARMDDLKGRIMHDDGAMCRRLTPEEWGRRLAGRSAEEIATALRGGDGDGAEEDAGHPRSG